MIYCSNKLTLTDAITTIQIDEFLLDLPRNNRKYYIDELLNIIYAPIDIKENNEFIFVYYYLNNKSKKSFQHNYGQIVKDKIYHYLIDDKILFLLKEYSKQNSQNICDFNGIRTKFTKLYGAIK